jgi:uncharacterized protein YrzB (UPF0473 family)
MSEERFEEFEATEEEELEDDGLVTLTDEDGEEHTFEHLDTFELNGEMYVALAPLMECEEEACECGCECTDEALFLRVEEDENGEEALSVVEDEAELDMVFEEFKTRNAEAFEFEDDGE